MTDYDCPPDIAKSPVLRHLWNVPHERKGNLIILTVGLPRTGKTEFDLALCHKLYRGVSKDFEHKFEPCKHVSFSKLNFQKNIQKIDTVGACLQWEEAGVAELGANARQFWSEGNISMSTLFQTMGFKRQIGVINLPLKMMLDKHLRSLIHVVVSTVKIDHQKKRVVAKLKLIRMPDSGSDPYTMYPRYVEDGIRHKVCTVSMPRAPPEIVDEYLEMEATFKRWLQVKLIRDEVKRQNKKSGVANNKSNTKLSAVFEKIKADPERYSKEYKNGRTGIDANAIRVLEDMSYKDAYALVGMMKKEEAM